MFVDMAGDFAPGQIPEWGSDWIRRRRKSSGAATKTETGEQKPAKNLATALADEPEKKLDPTKMAGREAARRARAEATRAAQLAGLSELEDWIFDNLSLGLPHVLSNLTRRCRTISARLSDAKAAALSGRLDDIPERVMSVPQPARADVLIEELGKLVLLSRAAQAVPQPVGVQRLISAAESRETVLEDADAHVHKAVWHVIASHAHSRRNGLVSYSAWLLSCEDKQRFAQLLDFVPARLGTPGAGFTVGDTFEAEVCYYPSAFPMRAMIKARAPTTKAPHWGTPPASVASQLAQALHAEPWIQDVPVLLGEGRLGSAQDGTLFWVGQSGEKFALHQSEVNPMAFGLPLLNSAAIMRHGRALLLVSETAMGRIYFDE